MGEKATVGRSQETAYRSRAKALGASAQVLSENLVFGLQQTLGNQAMLQLLESGTIRAKLRISQPGDSDEIEADRVAEKVVAASRAPVIHRKCASDGGAPCAKCAGQQDEETIHRSFATPQLRSLGPSIQRAPADPSSSPAATHAPATPEKQPAPGAKLATLIVEDNATKVEPHQMRKSQFIALLRTEACAAADTALASVKHTTRGCPYVAKWLSFYENQSSEHIERAIRKYAPEAASARRAREAIRIIVLRVERAALKWAKTGKVEGLPEELAKEISGGGGFLQRIHTAASTGVAGAILGFIGGKSADVSHDSSARGEGGSRSDRLMRKSEDGQSSLRHDVAEVKSELGTGHSLDSRVQSQMSSAFGHDFSSVRVHTDSGAAKLSSDLNARAFTVGSDLAFATGEYRPGTLIGDTLIAHELAHVVQQSGAAGSAPIASAAASDAGESMAGVPSRLEQDANRSALGAVASAWAGTKRVLADVRENAIPRMRSGLRLQRCPKSPQAVHPAAAAPVAASDTEPDAPSLPAPITMRFTDLAEGQWVPDPTGRNHHIEIERRGADLFYRLASGGIRRVPRPIDKEKKPPAPATIGKITWGGIAALQTAFSAEYQAATFSGGIDLPTFTVNIFGRATAGDLLSSLLQMNAAEISPEGLEYEAEAGTLSSRPKAKRFEDAKRYHFPDAPFSLYVFENRTAEVDNDATGRAISGPWSNVVDLKVSGSGDVSLIRRAKSGEETSTFSIKGPTFAAAHPTASKDPKERTDLITKLAALGVHVTERGSRFSVAELEAALSVLQDWKGDKGVVESLKTTGAPTLKLVKDILNNKAEYDPDTAEVRITGAVERPEQEQRDMVTHELTHALFHARGLGTKKTKVPEHVKAEAAKLRDLSEAGDIQEGSIKGPGMPSFSRDKRRSQEDWEQALSTNADLNAIWRQLHTRFRIGDPEGTGDIRGMDAADESRYSGSSRGDVVGHGFDNVTEFLSSFVTSSMAYQTQMSATILRAQSQHLAQIYKQLWDWVNTNLVALGKQNPYDGVLASLQKK